MINKKSITVLKALKNKDLNDTQIVALLGSASVAIPIIDNLFERKYIVKYTYTDETVTNEIRYRIYPYGEDILQEIENAKFAKIRYWVSYIITTVIATLAFLKSFFFI